MQKATATQQVQRPPLGLLSLSARFMTPDRDVEQEVIERHRHSG